MNKYPLPWKRKNSKYFYFTYHVRNKQIAKSTGCTTKGAAAAFIVSFMDHVAANLDTLGEYCRPYYEWETCPLIRDRLAENKSMGKEYVKQQRRHLERFLFSDPIAIVKLVNLKRGHILDWRSRIRQKHGIGPANYAVKTLKTILKYACYRGDIDRDPTGGIGNIKTLAPARGTFTREELDQMFNLDNNIFPQERIRMVFLLAAETGMRRGEIFALQWRDIDWEKHIITIRRAVNRSGLGLPKCNKIRFIAMSNRIEHELIKYNQDVLTIRDKDFIICWDDGKPLHTCNYNRWFDRIMKRMGIDKKARNLVAHSLRHTRVTLWKQAGIPLDAIQAMVGHSDEKTTGDYTHLQPDYLVDEVRRIEESGK